MNHVRLAIRSLRRHPGFSAVVILTMAVGIAANTAIFSVYDLLVLRPVTVADPASLVAIWFSNPERNVSGSVMSVPRYAELRDAARSFSSMGLSAFDTFTLTSAGEATQLNGLRISATFLPTLGLAPARGRNFSADEDVPNGPQVCIVSHELWQTRLGGREGIVGQTLELNGSSWEIVGVMPPRMSVPWRQIQVFAPRVFETGGLTSAQIQGGAGFAQTVARLRPGTTIEQARAELRSFSASYKARHPAIIDANNISEPRDFVTTLVAGFQPTMYTLLGAVACVLLIACANVASLFLSRLLKRRKEIAVRLSLGATRASVVRQFLAESFVFSSMAGALGTLLSMWALGVLQSAAAAQLPAGAVLSLNGRALAFAAVVTFGCALFTGLLPALQASRPNVVDQLKDNSRGTSSTHGARFRHALIVAEVTLSIVLLIGAALLLTSFLQLQRATPGFEPRGAAAAFVGLPAARYPTPAQQADFFERVMEQLRAQAGVTDVAVALSTPLTGGARTPYGIAGQPLPPLGQRPLIGRNVISDGYFRLLQIPVIEGRGFTPEDRQNAPPVCVVNETFARRAFQGRSAVGEALVLGATNLRVEIVGVIRDVKSAGVNAPTPDEGYFPLRQVPRSGMNIVAKTDGDASALQAPIRNAVATVDKTQAVSFFATMESTLSLSLGTQQLVAALTGVFAALALALSLIGLYAVLAYLVSQRTPEIGIRMALGATERQVVGLIMRSGLGLVAVGMVLGLAGAAAASRLIRQLLFGVGPLNPLIYLGVAVLFAVVAALACLGPSLRASRIDPLVAFRAE